MVFPQLRPGQSTLAFYTAENTSDRVVTGVSTYNVTPQQAGVYFNKIQCFCFEVRCQRTNRSATAAAPSVADIMLCLCHFAPARVSSGFTASLAGVLIGHADDIAAKVANSMEIPMHSGRDCEGRMA